MKDFTKLYVWSLSFKFACDIYDVLLNFPKDEIYGIISQMKRASLSISNNIAEGCGKRTVDDFVRFLYNSMGSVKEMENLILFSRKRNFLNENDFIRLSENLVVIGKMLNGLIFSKKR